VLKKMILSLLRMPRMSEIEAALERYIEFHTALCIEKPFLVGADGHITFIPLRDIYYENAEEANNERARRDKELADKNC